MKQKQNKKENISDIANKGNTFFSGTDWTILLILCCVMFLVQMNNFIIAPILKDIAKSFSMGESVGALISVYALSSAIIALLVGPLLDKYGRKNILLISLSAYGITTFLCGVSSSETELYLYRILSGMSSGPLIAGLFSYIGDHYKIEHRGKAIGILTSAIFIANLAGVPIGLAITSWAGWQYAFFFIGISSLILTPILSKYLIKTPGNTSIKLNLLNYGANIFSVFSNAKLFIYAIIYTLLFSSVYAFVSFYPVLLRHEKMFNFNLTQVGTLYALAGAASLIVSIYAGWLSDKFSKKSLTIASILVGVTATLVTSLQVLGYPFLSEYWASNFDLLFLTMILITILYMTSAAFRTVPLQALMLEISSVEERGRFMSILAFCQGIGVASGPIWGGWILSNFSFIETGHGYEMIGWISALVMIICAIFIFTHGMQKNKIVLKRTLHSSCIILMFFILGLIFHTFNLDVSAKEVVKINIKKNTIIKPIILFQAADTLAGLDVRFGSYTQKEQRTTANKVKDVIIREGLYKNVKYKKYDLGFIDPLGINALTQKDIIALNKVKQVTLKENTQKINIQGIEFIETKSGELIHEYPN